MPLNIDLVQVLLHMLNFVILAGGLTLLLFRPVRRFMDGRRRAFEERERKNSEDAAENERLKAEYEEKLRSLEAEAAAIRRKAETDAAGVAMDEREFHCRGEFKGMHKGRPNEADLAAAADFALSVAEG